MTNTYFTRKIKFTFTFISLKNWTHYLSGKEGEGFWKSGVLNNNNGQARGKIAGNVERRCIGTENINHGKLMWHLV